MEKKYNTKAYGRHNKTTLKIIMWCLNNFSKLKLFLACDSYSNETDPLAFRQEEWVFDGPIKVFKGKGERECEGIEVIKRKKKKSVVLLLLHNPLKIQFNNLACEQINFLNRFWPKL